MKIPTTSIRMHIIMNPKDMKSKSIYIYVKLQNLDEMQRCLEKHDFL